MSAAEHQGARILVVEDSETQALQLRRMLEREGFGVDSAPTAELALESMNERLPDLVIADYHLPGMNGDELARQIRLNIRTRAIPVLMLTEARERDLERHGLESGADVYVPKSADRDVILLRIGALLRRRRAMAAGAAAKGGDAEGAAAAGQARSGPATFRRAHLLVVEDGATYRAYLTDLLSRDGYVVEAVATPAEALEAVAAAPTTWDCVVVNVLSPGFDGVALCERLNTLRSGGGGCATTDGPSFQIVGLGSDDPSGKEMLAQVFAAGADDLVPATAEAQALSVRIRAAVRRKLLQDENRRAEAEQRERELAVERARAEAAAAQAKAALAEALARANAELEEANRRLKDTQAKLVQAAKMASLGELVAGIAHEINNPLAFILAHQGTVDGLLEKVEPGVSQDAEAAGLVARCRTRTRSMTLGLRRIQDLVLNLRKFSRLDEGGFQKVNVPDAIETVLALLAHKLGDRIMVERRFEAEPELLCSPALLNQVVMNIVGNAADAISGQGRITIATWNDDHSYMIQITDTGPGVPEELRDRIFEPFFTTKPVGQGTGLGLAIAYNVVQAHDGTITVGKGPEAGASFLVSVPRRSGR